MIAGAGAHPAVRRRRRLIGGRSSAVNRGSKADRAVSVGGSPAQTRTISVRLEAVSDTSFLLRVPVAIGTGNSNSPSAPARTKSGERKLALACEPVVSVLTEVAKLLQPGRCVT